MIRGLGKHSKGKLLKAHTGQKKGEAGYKGGRGSERTAKEKKSQSPLAGWKSQSLQVYFTTSGKAVLPTKTGKHDEKRAIRRHPLKQGAIRGGVLREHVNQLRTTLKRMEHVSPGGGV